MGLLNAGGGAVSRTGVNTGGVKKPGGGSVKSVRKKTGAKAQREAVSRRKVAAQGGVAEKGSEKLVSEIWGWEEDLDWDDEGVDKERIGKIWAQVRSELKLLDYQWDDVHCKDRFRWCCWSRQSGKSFTKSLRCLFRGLERKRTQVLLSAGERQSRELMLKVRQHCHVLAISSRYNDLDLFTGTQFKQLELRLPDNTRIIGLPANPVTARGFTGDVFLDEFAMHGNDREIWAAMYPTLLREEGDLDVASTPKGPDNVFASLRDNETFTHSTVTLPEAVRQGLEVDVEEARKAIGDEELFRQEFLCEFLDESSAFLTYEQIGRCEDETLELEASIRELARGKEELFVGVDIGRRRDLTVIWVFARVDGVLVARSVMELKQEPFSEQYRRLERICSLKNVRRCCIDAGGIGMQMAEMAEQQFGSYRIEGVVFTAAVKTQLASRLRIAIEDRGIRIPVCEAIRNDFHSIRRRISVGGNILLDSGRSGGSHADYFWAASLAVAAAGDAVGSVEMCLGSALRYGREGAW